MIDAEISSFVVHHRLPTLDPIMLLLSERVFLAAACALWVAALFALTQRRVAIVAVLVMAASIGLADLVGARIVKPWADRARPCHLQPEMALRDTCGPGRSMPSNHAATIAAGATVVAYFLRRRGVAMAVPLVFLVCLSRVYLGVHYPSDVVAGAVLGVVVAVLMLRILSLTRLIHPTVLHRSPHTPEPSP